MPRPVLVVDYDLTLADEHGVVHAPTIAALERWRTADGLVVIATGRPRWDIVGTAAHRSLFPEIQNHVHATTFDAGAGTADFATRTVRLLGDPLSPALVAAVTAAVPGARASDRTLQAHTLDPQGPADDPYLRTIETLVAAHNAAYRTAFRVSHNVRYIDVLPAPGVDKLVGLEAVLDDLRHRGADPGPLYGCGDAAIDVPFLDGCDISIAVERGARLAGRTDYVAKGLDGAGIVEVVDALLGHHRTPADADAALSAFLAPNSAPAQRFARRTQTSRRRDAARGVLDGLAEAGKIETIRRAVPLERGLSGGRGELAG